MGYCFMQKLILILTLLFLCFPCAAAPAENRAAHKKAWSGGQKTPQIGTVKKLVANGCGCSLQSPSDYEKRNQRFLFLSEFGGVVQMNIDGQDILLKLVKEPQKEGKLRVGSRHSETYASGQTTIRIDWTVSSLCAPDDEGCEVTWYTAVITVSRNGRTQKVNGRGLCGC
jgi:hypothetical protein